MKRITCIYLFVALVVFLPSNVQADSTYTIIDSSFVSIDIAGSGGGYAHASLNEVESDAYGENAFAQAITEVLFKPNFIGYGTPITFIGWSWGYNTYTYADIYDVISGERIFFLPIGPVDFEMTTFPYSEWNPDHRYKLKMFSYAWGEAIAIGGEGSMSHDMVFVPEPAPVPLPGAVWFLFSGLLGLVGVRRKMKN